MMIETKVGFLCKIEVVLLPPIFGMPNVLFFELHVATSFAREQDILAVHSTCKVTTSNIASKHANWQSTANMTCQLAKAKHANWQSTANCKNSTARPNPWKQSKSPNQGNIKFCRTALDTSERRQSNQPVTCQTLKCQTRDSSKPIWFTVSPFCLWNGSWDDHSKTVSLTVRPFCGDIWAGEK